MTSAHGGEDPQEGRQAPPPGQGWQQPPPQQGWQAPPPQGWQPPPSGQGWQQPSPGQGWQQPPQQGWQAPPPYPGYAPAPAAPGYQPGPAPRRPDTVRFGIGAFVATLVLGLISSVVTFSQFEDLIDETVAAAGDPAVTEEVVRTGLVVGAVIALLLVALQAMFMWFAWKGRNWARIVLFVLGGLGILSGLVALSGGTSVTGSGFLSALSVFSLLLTIAGVVLLALKPSNDWYRAMSVRRAAGHR